MNSNNNFLNSNFFQNTPQKDDKNKGWIIPQTSNTSFGAQSSHPTGFSNPSQMLNSSSGIFGQAPAAPAFGMGASQPMGSSSMGQGLNTFGSTPGAFGSTAPNTGGFGNTPGTFGTPSNTLGGFGTSNTFGGAPASQGVFGSTSWNPGISSSIPSPWSMNAKGSKAVSYNLTRIKEDTGVFSDLVDITGMKEYSSKSVDEIRKEDYEMSFSPPKPNMGFGSLFNQPMPSFQSVGQPGLSTGIGMPSGVGSGPFAGSSSNLFGATSTPSGFGTGAMNIGQPTGVTLNTPTSGLGTPTSPFGSTGFGTPKPFGSSVSQSAPTLGSNSNMFNTAGMSSIQPSFSSGITPSGITSSNTASQSSNPFGSSNTGVGTSSLFGNKPAGAMPNDSTLMAPPSFTTPFPKPQPSIQPPAQFSFGNGQNPFSSGAAGQPSNLFGGPSCGTLATSQPFGQSANPFGASQTTSGHNPFFNSTAASASQNSNVFQTNPFQSQTSTSFSSAPNQTLVDMNDPYLIKDVKFEKIQQQKPSVKVILPTPIFSTKKDVLAVDLKIRPPKPIARSSIYTIPDLNDVDTSRPIPNLVIGFEGKGRIEYQEPVTASTLEHIEKQALFRNENVEVNDPIGTGLNRKARVYVEGLFPVSRATNEIIKGKAESFPQKGIQERFIYQLKNDSTKKFIDYDVDSGIYVYEVNHF